MVEPKRVFDMIVSTLAIIVLLPLMALIAMAILIDTGRPILFCIRCHGRTETSNETYQPRPTTFLQLKFRTMRQTSTANHIIHLDNDPRITRTGKFLRATALDELPQLFNILMGHMSIVGPRPVTTTELERRPNCPWHSLREIPGYTYRSAVRPGLTGLSQLYLPKLVPLEDRFVMDGTYAISHSLLGDIKLLLVSLPISVSQHWELPGAKLHTTNAAAAATSTTTLSPTREVQHGSN
jgi:lipopolysaccharide/colanic/teichoic acid biosynthesis glycosyltransferase